MSLASISAAQIHQLSRSPAFAMSLGAKELFHTNFLAFLLESYDPELEGMQTAIRELLHFPVVKGALTRCAVWREKNNFDLILVELRSEPVHVETDGPAAVPMIRESWQWHNEGWYVGGNLPREDIPVAERSVDRFAGRVQVVEAKLKSLPNLAQLQQYDARLCSSTIKLKAPEDVDDPDVVCVFGGNQTVQIGRTLLSNAGESMTTRACDLTMRNRTFHSPANTWQGVSWRGLYNAMNAEIPRLNATPIRTTLIDYIQTLGALVQIIDNVHAMSDQAHANGDNGPPYGAVRREAMAAPFRSLRLHDLLGKTLFDHWMTHHVQGLHGLSVPDGWSANQYVHYTKGVPALNIELVKSNYAMPYGKSNTFRIGVQIQGPDFRLFVSMDQPWKDLDFTISQSWVLLDQWFNKEIFDTHPVGRNGAPIMPPQHQSRHTNLMVFDSNKFLYSAVRIDNVPIRRVEETILAMIEHACTIAPDLFKLKSG